MNALQQLSLNLMALKIVHHVILMYWPSSNVQPFVSLSFVNHRANCLQDITRTIVMIRRRKIREQMEAHLNCYCCIRHAFAVVKVADSDVVSARHSMMNKTPRAGPLWYSLFLRQPKEKNRTFFLCYK